MNLPDVVFGRDRYRMGDTWNFFFAWAVCKAGPPEIRRSHMVHSKTVTGSAVGLGIAEAFAHSGANVVLNGFGDALQIEKSRTELAHGRKATDTATDAVCGISVETGLLAGESPHAFDCSVTARLCGGIGPSVASSKQAEGMS
jgi:hypothetical protein